MELIKTYLADSLDASFDEIFKKKYTKISKVHWTPIEVVKIATNWLATSSDTKILDIGSGVGKFCVVGALISDAHFYGVEIRTSLVNETNRLKKKLNLEKIQVLNENVININFEAFDSFYYFNPFCEQITDYDLIDDTITRSVREYESYEKHVFNQLEKSKIGARLVTYFSSNFSPPISFRIKDMMFDGELVFWEKMKN